MKLSSIPDAEWDAKLKKSPYADYFHTSLWKNQVTSCIGGTAELYSCKNKEKEWLVPVYQKGPWSKGFRIGSIGYGGPLPLQPIEDVVYEHQSFLHIISLLKEMLNLPCTGATLFPFKEWSLLQPNETEILTSTQIIPLLKTPLEVFDQIFTGNVRTTIRRAEQASLEPSILQTDDEIKNAHQLLIETQQRVNASYTTPFNFFSELSKSSNTSLWGIKDKGELIAISLLLIYEKKAFHLFHGWNKDIIQAGTNQLLIWEMIKDAVLHNCDSFNMGESHSESLRVAKKRWGAEDISILRLNLSL